MQSCEFNASGKVISEIADLFPTPLVSAGYGIISGYKNRVFSVKIFALTVGAQNLCATTLSVIKELCKNMKV